MRKSLLALLCLCLASVFGYSQNPSVQRIGPSNWWVGMKNPHLQLLVYGKNLKGATVSINYAGVQLTKVNEVDNPNYLFLDLTISPETKAGTLLIDISKTVVTTKGKKSRSSIVHLQQPYELKVRNQHPQEINSADLVYLILPDRFANGDPSNDKFADMADTAANRSNPFLRHGGDLKGIQQHLDYFTELGITTLWLNPVVENNQPQTNEGGEMRSAYHGYGFTDHYNVDRRLGGNSAYKELVEAAHAKGLKVVQDAVYNHVGINHWILKDLPMKSWLNQWDEYTNTSYRDEPIVDIVHANKSDFKIQQNGWFVPFLPDLNHHNEFVANYLIQHALWTVEYFGVDGWRIDTYQYNDLPFMNRCNQALLDEYPKMFITGENSVQSVVSQAYFTRNNLNVPFKSNLPSPNDFVLFHALNGALKEDFDWGKGLNRLYSTLANDLVYEDPSMNMTFLDNHDMDRFYSVIGEDFNKFKLGMGFLLTTRGIPQIYYGTENLTKNFKNPSDAEVRKDFVGGWATDKESKFVASGRTAQENEAFNFTKILANYRKSSAALQSGKLTQYLPQDGIYVYFRHKGTQSVMVIMSQAKEVKTLSTKRFAENLAGFTKGKEITTNKDILSLDNITVAPMSIQVIELN